MAQLDMLAVASASPPKSKISDKIDFPLENAVMQPNAAMDITVKSEGAYRTISEVAEELDVPTHVLRFWESRFPQVKPQRMRGGRRYYRPADVLTLKKIKTLLYSQGFTIKGARKYVKQLLQEQDSKQVITAPEVAVVVEAPQKAEVKHEAAAGKPRPEIGALINELKALKQSLAAFN